MNNLPIAWQTDNSNPPVLPEEMLSQYNAFAEQMTTGFGGAFNRVKVGKMDFSLAEGGVVRRVNNGDVMGVCLGMSPIDYCSWYEKTYEPGQEPEIPDLVWNWSDHSKFPDALPAQWRQKKNRQNQERWDFRIARRSVWALLNQGDSGQFFLNLDTPYIFDITSASLYGKSDTAMNWYKWSGLIQLCSRFSRPPNFICSPAMFVTRVRIDPTSTVSGVVYFEPMMGQNGSPAYVDSNTFTKIVEVMQTQTVRDMLQVREILEWPKKNVVPIATGPIAQQTSVATAEMDVAAVTPPAQYPASEIPQTPPMQTATAVATPPTSSPDDNDTVQSRLAAAQAILNQAAASSSQAESVSAKPAGSVHQSAAASSNVNSTTADAIRAFSDVL